MKPILTSMLDNDLYKFSMQQSVLFGRPAGIKLDSVKVRYEFQNRGKTPFPMEMVTELCKQIEYMKELKLTDEEADYLAIACPYLRRSYIQFLKHYRYEPSQVGISTLPVLEPELNSKYCYLNLSIHGLWWETILWEVPLMALISELYFKFQGCSPKYGWKENMSAKAELLAKENIRYADFGTRRRFSIGVQSDAILTSLTARKSIMSDPSFFGTSNVKFAKDFDITPIGTHAHELFMGHQGLFGVREANRMALQTWTDEFDGNLGIALTDTFTSDVFFRDFSLANAKMFDGLRQDSGSPFDFAEKAIRFYNRLGIDPRTKKIVFSDSLNPQKAIDIHKKFNHQIQCVFGIGTNLSNDVGHKPLNMVIKMTECNDVPVVKLSDDLGKASGDPKAVERCKQELGLK